MNYPIHIRFWYAVHDAAEWLWHWVFRTKLRPWFDARNEAPIHPKYTLIETIPATTEEVERGITARHIYASPAVVALERGHE